MALLLSTPRTATIRAKTHCELFVLEKTDFSRILRDHPQFAETMMQIARERYDLVVSKDQLMAAV